MSEPAIREHHPPRPRPCEKCKSTNVTVTLHHEYVEFTCNDCGYQWTKEHHRPHKEGEIPVE